MCQITLDNNNFAFYLLALLSRHNDTKFLAFRNKRLNQMLKQKKILYILRRKTYRSVVDFTSSRFHKPQVNWRAVDAKSSKLTQSNKPIGPKKYAKISMSPVFFFFDIKQKKEKRKEKRWN